MEAGNRKARERERIARSAYSDSLPPHLSDLSHGPVPERMDRSGTGSFHGRASPILQRRLRLTDHHAGMLDSHGNGSLMEVETRSRAQTPTASTTSSGMALISALHVELERARLQVNQMIQEQRSDQNEINYLMKSFGSRSCVYPTRDPIKKLRALRFWFVI
ncbi:hypothetical protein ACFX13_028142 [Malus domestica]